MTDTPVLSGPEQAPTDGKKPDRLIIFLHGLGANGDDLISLAPVLGQVFPTAQFLAPNAPEECDMAPMGLQWFSLQDMSREQLQAGVDSVTPVLHRYLDDQIARFSVTPDRVAIVGFSQGTMMALHVGLRRLRPLAGLLGYSGALAGPEHLGADLRHRFPVLLVHGGADEVLPADLTRHAARALAAHEVPVRSHIEPGLGHGINEMGLRLGVDFLGQTLPA